MNEEPTRRPRSLAIVLLLLLLALLLMASSWPRSDAGFSSQKSNPDNTMRAAQTF